MVYVSSDLPILIFMARVAVEFDIMMYIMSTKGQISLVILICMTSTPVDSNALKYYINMTSSFVYDQNTALYKIVFLEI